MKAPRTPHCKCITFQDLVELFPDNESGERWFEEQRWGECGKPDHCPLCGSSEMLRAVPSGKPLPYWCGSCRRNFSVRVGTALHRSSIPLNKWAIAIHLWSASPEGISFMKLHRNLGITQKSAYRMARRLLEAWSELPVDRTGSARATNPLCSRNGGTSRE